MFNPFSKLLRRKKREDHPFCSAIVAAAGSSRRMEGENKLLLPLEGIPVLARTLLALDAARLVDEIVVAVREADLLTVGDLCKIYGVSKPVKIVRGGATRLESVRSALLECREDAAFLAVHDGARPLAEPELIDRVVSLAHRTNAAAPAVPVKDTVKLVRDPAVHLEVLERFLDHAAQAGFTVKGLDFSPIRGPEGNIEYLGFLQAEAGEGARIDLRELVDRSHQALKG